MNALFTDQRIESSDFVVLKAAGSPTQAFGDDDFVLCYFHVSFKLLHDNNWLYQSIAAFVKS